MQPTSAPVLYRARAAPWTILGRLTGTSRIVALLLSRADLSLKPLVSPALRY